MSIEATQTGALQPFMVEANVVYPIDVAARLAQMPRHRVMVCCKRGLISPLIDPDDGRYSFDGATIGVLQRIEYLHTECGVNYTGIRIILSLAEELERFRDRLS